MAKNFRYKHINSAVADKTPSVMFEGEIAVNRFAGKEKLFIKNTNQGIVDFVPRHTVEDSINAATSGKVNTSTFNTHTASTVHMTTTEKTNLDSLATNIAAISGISSSDVTNWNGKTSNVGTVTKVGISLPNALSASTTAVTTSGTFNIGLANGYTIPTTAEETSWNGAVTNLGGFKLVEITQSDYDNLPTPRDSKTLYIIRN